MQTNHNLDTGQSEDLVLISDTNSNIVELILKMLRIQRVQLLILTELVGLTRSPIWDWTSQIFHISSMEISSCPKPSPSINILLTLGSPNFSARQLKIELGPACSGILSTTWKWQQRCHATWLETSQQFLKPWRLVCQKSSLLSVRTISSLEQNQSIPTSSSSKCFRH